MFELYKNIRELRLELGITQTELAAKTGYADKSMIAKIESGKVDLPQSKIELFAAALRTTPRHLMGWDREAPDPRVLTPDESTLLDRYGRLNTAGKTKAQEYISDLTEQRKYTSEKNSALSEDVS